MRRGIKRALSLLLALSMVMGLAVTTAFAQEETPDGTTEAKALPMGNGAKGGLTIAPMTKEVFERAFEDAEWYTPGDLTTADDGLSMYMTYMGKAFDVEHWLTVSDITVGNSSGATGEYDFGDLKYVTYSVLTDSEDEDPEDATGPLDADDYKIKVTFALEKNGESDAKVPVYYCTEVDLKVLPADLAQGQTNEAVKIYYSVGEDTESIVYDGKVHKPTVTAVEYFIRDDISVYVPGTDIMVAAASGSNMINAQQHTVEVNAGNNTNFTGKATIKYSITGKSVSGLTVKAENVYYTVKGDMKPVIRVYDGTRQLTLGTDYKTVNYYAVSDTERDYPVSGDNPFRSVGSYFVEFEGMNNYTGYYKKTAMKNATTYSADFEVEPIQVTGVKITTGAVSGGNIWDNTLTATLITDPATQGTTALADEAAKVGMTKFTWYAVPQEGNPAEKTAVEEATPHVYKVGAQDATAASPKAFKVEVKAADDKAAKVVAVMGTTLSASVYLTVSEIQAADIAWDMNKLDGGNYEQSSKTLNYTYDGKEKKPGVVVTVDGKRLTEGTHYTLSYENNTNVGSPNTGAVCVTGINDYVSQATAKKTFSIYKAESKVSKSTVDVKVGGTQTVTVTGDADSIDLNGGVKSDMVAEATASGNLIYITGVTAGTGTLRVTMTHNNYEDLDVNITVNVTDPSGTEVEDEDDTYNPFWPEESDAPGSSTGSTATPGTTTTTGDDGTVTTVTVAEDGSKTVDVTKADGSTGTVKSDAQGNTLSAVANVSEKAVSDAAASGDAVKLPIEVEAADGAMWAGEIEVNLPANSGEVKVDIPVSNVSDSTVAIIVHADGTEEIVKMSVASEDGVLLTLDGSTTLKIVDNTKSFNDVAGNEWFAKTVAWASSHEIMNGMGDGGFSPDTPMSRAMLAQMLFNVDGAKGGSVTDAFGDVKAGQWFAESVTWALENGVAQGDGANFNPDQTLTREQMVVMIYNYAKGKGYDTTRSTSLNAFNDAGSVASWAQDAMGWAVDVGLIGGMGDGTVAPQGNATRAQLATIMQRFVAFTLK